MSALLIASDHGGYFLKEKLKAYLAATGKTSVTDLGPFCKARCDYPSYASAVAKEISSGRSKRGILICKSGIGNSIVANRYPGVRAALCYNQKAARLSREHNDSNVLVLGASFVNASEAKRIVSVWLRTEFQGARHTKRLNLIKKIEAQIRREYI